jgi:hypothetical protein
MPKVFAIMLLGGSLVAANPALSLRSAKLATNLAAALANQKLEAIAAEDPNDPGRFIAALLAPGQLLIISARFASADTIQARLIHRQYRDVYLDLQASTVADGKWFLQDMQADGLCSGRDQVADVVFDANSAATVFDGDWKSHGWSEKEYHERLGMIDQRYSRLLEVLLGALSTGSAPAGA